MKTGRVTLIAFALLFLTAALPPTSPAGGKGKASPGLFETGADLLYDLDAKGREITRLPDSVEIEIGKGVDQKIRAEKRLCRDEGRLALAGEVFARLKKGATRKIPYRLTVLDDATVNAYAAPGGFTYVTTGLLNYIKDDRDQLALVLGHEITHNEKYHVIGRIQYAAIAQGLIGVNTAKFVDIAYGLLTIPFEKRDEFEADDGGAVLSDRAGYAVSRGILFFDRLAQEEEKQGESTRSGKDPAGNAFKDIAYFFRSHPYSRERAARLRELGKKKGFK